MKRVDNSFCLHKFGGKAHEATAASAAPLALHVHLQSHLAGFLNGGLLAGAIGNLAAGRFAVKELLHSCLVSQGSSKHPEARKDKIKPPAHGQVSMGGERER